MLAVLNFLPTSNAPRYTHATPLNARFIRETRGPSSILLLKMVPSL